MKNKKEENKKVEEFFTASQVGVLIEGFDDKLNLIFENQELMEKRLENKMDERFAQVDKNFELVFEHFSNIEDELLEHKKRLEKIESRLDEIELGLDGVKKRLEKIEKELAFVKKRLERLENKNKKTDKDKVAQKEILILEARIEKIEKKLEIVNCG